MAFSPETYVLLSGMFKRSEQNKVTKKDGAFTPLMKSYLDTGFNDAADNSIFQVTAQSSAWGYGFIGYKWKSTYPCRGILFLVGSQGENSVTICERDSEGNWTGYSIN